MRAHIAAAPPRLLRWRLETVARGPGRTRNVSRSEAIQGGSDRPVSMTSVWPNRAATVILTVHDGLREVAREEVRIEGGRAD